MMEHPPTSPYFSDGRLHPQKDKDGYSDKEFMKLEPGIRFSGFRLSGGGPLTRRWSVGGKMSEEKSCHTISTESRRPLGEAEVGPQE